MPHTIGRYQIIATLGEGGMGTVYEAVQDQPHRTVALKVIRPDFVSPEMSRRFALESDILGRLQHPGIAQIYEAGTAEGQHGPVSFFAMELVRGQPLTAYADQHQLDLTRRLELFAKICDAVHYAHQQGVVHRDLKPANILVDATGQPKILDFGVARLTNPDSPATQQTTIGKVMGTLQYMSPEQVNADPNDLDARSDVYTLGVILYELVTGKLPYDLAKKMIYEAARVIMVDDPAPISTINRRLAGDVEVIVATALVKEPSRRYQSAEFLASDIRRFLRDEPITARPASAMYQLRKFARRNRALVGGIVAAASILLIGTVVSTWLAVRATAAERVADAQRREAVTASQAAIAASQLADQRRAVADSALGVADSARAAAQREAAKARAINAFLQDMLASASPENAQGQDLSVRALLDRAGSGAATASLAAQPEVQAEVEATIARTYFALGLYDQSRPHFDSALTIRTRVLGPRDISVAQSHDELGKLAQAMGDAPQAEDHLRQALAIFRPRMEANDDRISSALAALADAQYVQGKFPEAESAYREALALSRERHGNNGTELSGRLASLGSFLSYTGRAPDALPYLEEAVAIRRRMHGDNHPEVVTGLVALSDAYHYKPDDVAAERTLRETLPLAHQVYGDEHPVIANVLSRLGTALSTQRKLEEAEPLMRASLAMRIKLLGEQHPDVQLQRVELGRLMQALGKYAEAEALYTQALAGRRAVLGDSSPAIASSLTDLGILARLRENWPTAERHFRDATPIWRSAGIEDQELYTLAELGSALERQDKLDEAETMLEDVLRRRRALFGDGHWSVGDTYEKISMVLFDRGRLAEAESLGAMGLEIRQRVYGPRTARVASQLLSMAFFAEARGDTIGAIPLVRESLSMLASRPPTDQLVLGAQRVLAIDLCATGDIAEGDSLVRSAVGHMPLDSTLILPYRLRAALGFCLTRAGRFAEAEAALLEAETGLRALSPAAARYRDTTVDWLVDLYGRWGNAEQAAIWKQRRSAR